ncbi:MAG: acetyl-CoA carboxylase biotin carboxyl carrier protein [Calditrichaeota bacterium]|nr:acetyl-CoA carboxylase biotin carboxyl carrier protein [Calditrichota bacterium]MCB9368289.1 acetyl-CoA carboxylase biotin carboxyl carrier protein [Calditrichota bacterium]
MELTEIQKLIRMIERSPINEFELVENDLKIRISKNSSNGTVTVASLPQAPMMAPMGYPQQAALQAPQATVSAAAPSEPKAPSANVVEVKAPMVGTFYRAPSPDAEPYVRVGDVVEPGKVLCIVEAMKLMNEIEAEFKGKVVDVLLENAQPVEFGQVMFRIERMS